MQSFTSADVDCSTVTGMNINCPETWPDIPQNILDNPDLAKSALECVHSLYGDETKEAAGDSYLIDLTVTTINYVNVMAQFYNVMAALRIVFQIVLIVY